MAQCLPIAYQDRTKHLPVIKPFDTTCLALIPTKRLIYRWGISCILFAVNRYGQCVNRGVMFVINTKLTLILMGDDANLSTITAWAAMAYRFLSSNKKRILLRKRVSRYRENQPSRPNLAVDDSRSRQYLHC